MTYSVRRHTKDTHADMQCIPEEQVIRFDVAMDDALQQGFVVRAVLQKMNVVHKQSKHAVLHPITMTHTCVWMYSSALVSSAV